MVTIILVALSSRDQGRPSREPDAAVAGRAADRFGITSAVEADAIVVQLHPDDAHGIIGPGREYVGIVTLLALANSASPANWMKTPSGSVTRNKRISFWRTTSATSSATGFASS